MLRIKKLIILFLLLSGNVYALGVELSNNKLLINMSSTKYNLTDGSQEITELCSNLSKKTNIQIKNIKDSNISKVRNIIAPAILAGINLNAERGKISIRVTSPSAGFDDDIQNLNQDIRDINAANNGTQVLKLEIVDEPVDEDNRDFTDNCEVGDGWERDTSNGYISYTKKHGRFFRISITHPSPANEWAKNHDYEDRWVFTINDGDYQKSDTISSWAVFRRRSFDIYMVPPEKKRKRNHSKHGYFYTCKIAQDNVNDYVNAYYNLKK